MGLHNSPNTEEELKELGLLVEKRARVLRDNSRVYYGTGVKVTSDGGFWSLIEGDTCLALRSTALLLCC